MLKGRLATCLIIAVTIVVLVLAAIGASKVLSIDTGHSAEDVMPTVESMLE